MFEVLSALRADHDPNIVVGRELPDDAGVYRLADGALLVQAVDIIAPIVNDPAMFGRVAAANALSDVYAMGGRPFAAMNIACFPSKKLPLWVLEETMRGAMETLGQAGCALVGGHTVDDPEFKFGFSVSGLVEGGPVYRIDRAEAGQTLVLTKPIGTGVVNQCLRKRVIEDHSEPYLAAQRSMIALNQRGAQAARAAQASTATDITGFGLLGHLSQFARASGVTVEVFRERVPVFPGVPELIAAGHVPKRARENADNYRERVDGIRSFEESILVFDPQTSGGLVVALPPDQVDTFIRAMGDWPFGVHVMGRVCERADHDVRLV